MPRLAGQLGSVGFIIHPASILLLQATPASYERSRLQVALTVVLAGIVSEDGKRNRCIKTTILACEQAPRGASAEQSFGAKHRAIGACTHSPKSPMPPTWNYLVSCQISTNQHTPEVKVQNKSKQIMIHMKAWCVHHVSQRNSKKVICG